MRFDPSSEQIFFRKLSLGAPADKTAEQHRAKAKQKLTRLQDTKNAKRRKPDANWVRNISSRPLDETETQVLSYGLKHSVTPKQILLRLLYLALRLFCLANTSYQNRPRITSEVECPLLYNQPHYRTVT